MIQVLPCDLSSQQKDGVPYFDIVMTCEYDVSSIEASVILPDGMTVTNVDYPVAFQTKDYNDGLDDKGIGRYCYFMGMSIVNIIKKGENTPVFRVYVSLDKDKIKDNTVYPIYVHDWYLCNEDYSEETDAFEKVCTSCIATGPDAFNEIEARGTISSMLSAIPDGSFQVSVDMTNATDGVLNLNDKIGLTKLPTVPLNKVTYSRSSLASQYGTICVPVELKSDSKIQYYTISAAAEGSITIEAVSTLPAGTPAIYENKGATSIEASEENVTLTAAGTTGTGAELVGTYAKTKIDAPNTYYLKGGKFNRVNGNFFSGNFKAYAQSSEALAKALEIFVADDDATAINGASKSASIEAIYNAAGAQNKKLEKGVNILKMSDGSIKKVLVK